MKPVASQPKLMFLNLTVHTGTFDFYLVHVRFYTVTVLIGEQVHNLWLDSDLYQTLSDPFSAHVSNILLLSLCQPCDELATYPE